MQAMALPMAAADLPPIPTELAAKAAAKAPTLESPVSVFDTPIFDAKALAAAVKDHQRPLARTRDRGAPGIGAP